MPESDPFLTEAWHRGLITAAQAEDCRRIAAALAEVQVELTVDEIVARKGYLTSAQTAEIRRSLSRLRIGRYDVIERLGEGAAGVVWKARDTKLDRVVALKVLSQKAQSAQTFRERFIREARIAVTLNHVNIVRGLDYGEADGYQYFAMEFVDGENAEARLARVGRIPEREAVAMALDVVRALEYVQKFLIVHRDIKPGNLLLTSSGHVKLCDLGLAKPMLAESELMAGDGSTAGTPFYMSPEQIREPEKIDWRSDVYSLGATLYHLLTGVPVFQPDPNVGVIQKHLRDRPRNPREHVLELSDGVAAVVMRMLQKEPDDRYASIAELSGDLESVLAGRPPLHTAPPLPPDEATAERHARHNVARRINQKNLPRDSIPWAAVAFFGMLAAAVIAVGLNMRPAKAPEEPSPGRGPGTQPPGPTPRQDPPPGQPVKPPGAVTPPAPVADPFVERMAADELRTRTQNAQPLIEEGKFDAARAVFGEFPEKWKGTNAALDFAAARQNIEVTAAGRCNELLAKADDAARRHRFDEARDLIGAAAHVQCRRADEDARAKRGQIEALARKYDDDRVAQADAYAQLYCRALHAAATDTAAVASGVVDRDAPSLPAYGDDVSELREDLRVLERNGADPDTIDETNAKGALALLLIRLARGEVALASNSLAAVRATGGDADAARARIARVESVLVREGNLLLDQARAALAADTPDAAATIAAKAQQLLPGWAPATVILGRARLAKNELAQAIDLLHSAAQDSDAPLDAHLWYGQALARKGDDLARAETEIQQFLSAAPAGDPRRVDAEAALRDAHGRRVESEVRKWRAAAKTLQRAGKRDAAEGAWGRVAELLPDDADALSALSLIYADKKTQVPEFVLLSRIGRVAATDAQKKRAADRIAKLKADNPSSVFATDDGRATVTQAESYFANENWAKARSTFQQALSLSPHLSSARVKLIRACLAEASESKDLEHAREAADLADALGRLYPDEALPIALKAEAELALGDAAKALKDAKLAVLTDKTCAAAHLAAGHAQLAAGDAAKAQAAFGESNSLEASPEAHLGLARAYIALGDPAEARGVLNAFKLKYGTSSMFRDEYNELLKVLSGGK